MYWCKSTAVKSSLDISINITGPYAERRRMLQNAICKLLSFINRISRCKNN